MSPLELQAMRERLGLQQKQLAKMLDVSQSAVHLWEQGERTLMGWHLDRVTYIKRLGEIALARRGKLDWSL